MHDGSPIYLETLPGLCTYEGRPPSTTPALSQARLTADDGTAELRRIGSRAWKDEQHDYTDLCIAKGSLRDDMASHVLA